MKDPGRVWPLWNGFHGMDLNVVFGMTNEISARAIMNSLNAPRIEIKVRLTLIVPIYSKDQCTVCKHWLPHYRQLCTLFQGRGSHSVWPDKYFAQIF